MGVSSDSVTVDVMVPFYGDVAHLMSALKSVTEQTFQNWKMFVVDDGYPDESVPKKVESLMDSRITYIRNPSNLGANENYRKCIGLATSELVVMMGADDVMLPNYLQVVTETFIQYPHASMFHPKVEVIDQDGRVCNPLADRVKKKYSPNTKFPADFAGEELASSLIKGNWTYFPAICWRRNDLINHSFRDGLNVTQDLALLIDQICAGAHLIYVPVTAFQYRRHLASDSSVKAVDGSRFIEESRLFKDFERQFSKIGWVSAAKTARIHFSSRMNALLTIPKAIKYRNLQGAKRLLIHTFESPRRA